MLGSRVYQGLPEIFKSNFEKDPDDDFKNEYELNTKVTDHLNSSEKALILETLEKYM